MSLTDPAPRPAAPPWPTAWYVRDVRVAPAVALAPMEGVTDLAFRRLVRRVGRPGLTSTEFIAARGLSESRSKRLWRVAAFDPDERPIAIQIFGKEPPLMAEAARLLEAHGASIIDINMGCPSKKVCANSGGSALMSDLPLAARIVREARRAVSIPLTVKMRSGPDPTRRNAAELARICEEEGADAVTIHWRTRADGYGGERDVTTIAEAVDRVRIPVIGNGDITDIPSARAMLEETGCAGVMVGRGVVRNPWLPAQIGQWLNGEPVHQPSPEERRDALLLYFDLIEEAFGDPNRGLGRKKMVMRYFTEGLPEGASLKHKALRAPDSASLRAHVRDWFSSGGS